MNEIVDRFVLNMDEYKPDEMLMKMPYHLVNIEAPHLLTQGPCLTGKHEITVLNFRRLIGDNINPSQSELSTLLSERGLRYLGLRETLATLVYQRRFRFGRFAARASLTRDNTHCACHAGFFTNTKSILTTHPINEGWPPCTHFVTTAV